MSMTLCYWLALQYCTTCYSAVIRHHARRYVRPT